MKRGTVRAILVFVSVLLLWPTDATASYRRLRLVNVHTEETLSLRPFAAYGRLRRLEWARLTRFFRSWRVGARRPVNPRLVRQLARAHSHFGARNIELVSGYRAPEKGSRPSSYHQVGHAADLRVPGVSTRVFFEWCRAQERLGCGFYPKGHHVHMDVRARAAMWVDLSGYGDGAHYVRDAAAWLRRHKE
jgi:uncharacterized protein YcbK (DUF882 family)